MCKCDPHRRGYCDECSIEMSRAREERSEAAAKRAAKLIRQYVPESDERHAVLYALGDDAAIREQLVRDEQRQHESDIAALESNLQRLKAKDQAQRLKEKGLDHLVKSPAPTRTAEPKAEKEPVVKKPKCDLDDLLIGTSLGTLF